MLKQLRHLLRDERGATAIEYGLLAALLSLAMVVALESMGSSISAFWGDTSTKMAKAAGEGE